MREASVTFVRKRACALSVRWRTQQHQARAVGEDNSLQPLEVHCLKQTAEPSLCSIVGVCLGIVSAGVCVREMLLAAPRGTCRRLRRGGMGLIDVDRPEI